MYNNFRRVSSIFIRNLMFLTVLVNILKHHIIQVLKLLYYIGLIKNTKKYLRHIAIAIAVRIRRNKSENIKKL